VSADVDGRLRAEALRLYRRYAIEIVEGLSFCPYAAKTREDGHTREVVVTSVEPSDEEILEAIEAIADDPVVEVGLLIVPRLTLDQPALGHRVEDLRKAHADRRGRTVLAIEGFHPRAEADATAPERLTPFVRRTPDPTLQLTRLDVLERVRRGTPTGTAFFDPDAMDLDALLSEPTKAPLHERIADMNLETVRRLGVDEVAARLRDILEDRDRSYAAIDPSIPRWG